jgi:predicted nucleic acid-binding protein
MIFVDTGAWFASVVPWDSDHAAAQTWLSQNRAPFFTTDFIVDETLTLLRVRGESARATLLGEKFFKNELAELYFLQEMDIRAAWQIFHQFADKEWSFTDCTSKLIIEKLGLQFAFAFDQHFRQFGSVQVVP